MLARIGEVFLKGGPVMWPLLALSVVSVALSVERAIFWIRTHRPGISGWLAGASQSLQSGDVGAARSRLKGQRHLYAEVVGALAEEPGVSSVALVERHRPRFERFSASLSTIITAAPLLGILGTVLGIIESFEVMSAGGPVQDINAVAGGIAEALITTAFGLIVALVTLFPAMIFRAHAERCLGAIEMLSESVAVRKAG